MSKVILFHHAQGLTPGVTAFADRLRAAGHDVHTPDLFEGQTFESIAAGMARVGEIGFGAIMERGAQAADAIGDDAVFMGMSLGVVPAQMLAQTRPRALGAVLCYSCVPVSEFGDAWPTDVPVQIHGMDADPYFIDEGDIDAAREIVASAPQAELFLYPGDQHYFADSSLASYDPDATEVLIHRVLDLLSKISDETGGVDTA
jgi:dienelactone hydrolase